MTLFKFPRRVSRKEVNSSSKALSSLPQDPKPYVVTGWMIVLFGVIGFLGWSAFAPLDKGVSVTGTVIVEGRTKTVHHLDGGQIEAILVNDGEPVTAGQLMIRMNDTRARSKVEGLRLQLDKNLALLARLKSESEGLEGIHFPEDLQGRDETREIMRSQKRLFETRKRILTGRLASFDELMAGYGSQLQGVKESKVSRELQRKALKEQLQGMYELESRGYVAKNRILEMERLHEQINGAISEDIGQIGQLQRQLQQMKLNKQSQKEEFLREVHDMLAETEVKVQDLTQQLHAAQYELANTRVVAPSSGTVVNLSVFTEGGFIDPGAHLLDIVPAQDQLQVEAQVPVNLIDKVHPGLPVTLMFSAFNQSVTPQVPAELEMVSADRLVDNQTGQPYYRVQAKVNNEGMAELKGQKLRPGMPVEVFIRLGERTLMSYLFKPMLDRTRTALVEK